MSEIINYLGVDWGEKRIGLATGDSETNIALPSRTVATLDELLKAIETDHIDVIVLGAPRKMGGAEANNPLWLNFLDKLKKSTSCRIELVDERLSSLAADALFGNKNEKANRDEIAAAVILQDYLDLN